MNQPTRRQREVLDFIQEFTEDRGYAPSYREIANYLGVTSVATVADHIDRLEAKGLLEKGAKHLSRSTLAVEPDVIKKRSHYEEIRKIVLSGREEDPGRILNKITAIIAKEMREQK